MDEPREVEDSLLDLETSDPEPKTNRRKMKVAFVAIIFLSLLALAYNSIYVSYFENLDKQAQTLREQIDSGLKFKAEYEAELNSYLTQSEFTASTTKRISASRAEWLKKFIDVETRLATIREKLLATIEKRDYLAIINYANETSPIIQERIELRSEEPAQ